MASTPGGLLGTWEYNSDLFDPATIERASEHLRRLLEGIASDADQSLWQLPLVGERERRRAIRAGNDTSPYRLRSRPGWSNLRRRIAARLPTLYGGESQERESEAANASIYVFDRHRQLSPVGVPGEVHVALGRHLSRASRLASSPSRGSPRR